MNKKEQEAMEILKNTRQAWAKILYRLFLKQQEEINFLKYKNYNLEKRQLDMIHTDRILDKLKEISDDGGTFDAKIVLENLLKEN